MSPQRGSEILKFFFFLILLGPSRTRLVFQPFCECGCHLGSIATAARDRSPRSFNVHVDHSGGIEPGCRPSPHEPTRCLQNGWKSSLLKNMITNGGKNFRAYSQTHLSQSEKGYSLLVPSKTWKKTL